MPRELALSILLDITEKGAFADLAVKNGLAASRLEKRDKSLATSLVYGTVQNLRFIDFQIASVSARPIESLTPAVREILRMAVHQLRFMDRIPGHAAVNEAVNMTKRHARSAASYVNGVLRNIQRRGFALPDTLQARLGVEYSVPDYLVQLWMKQFGAEECEKLLAASNAVPPLAVRINPLKSSAEEVAAVCKARKTNLENALYIEEPKNIAETAMFREGWLSIQDIGAQMASLALDPEPGERVLDLCAAPGGKTTHMAELMENSGEITAWDIYPHKVELILKNARRLGISIIKAGTHDARIPDEQLFGCFDKVMADVPCSGLGILRKKPDIKWQRTEEDLASLTAVQTEILENAAQCVRSGGAVLYCTCTINRAENEDVVEAFLKSHPDFSPDGEARMLLPHRDNTDGFFFARLRKR